MPPGSFEMSLRSRASSAAAEILVLAAIGLSEMPRRSRAWRSLPPKSPIAATLHEPADGRQARGARTRDIRLTFGRDAADGHHRHRRARARAGQGLEPGDRMVRRLAG